MSKEKTNNLIKFFERVNGIIKDRRQYERVTGKTGEEAVSRRLAICLEVAVTLGTIMRMSGEQDNGLSKDLRRLQEYFGEYSNTKEQEDWEIAIDDWYAFYKDWSRKNKKKP